MASLSTRINRRVKRRLTASGRTQAELAAFLGVSQPVVSRRLSGHRAWSIREIEQVAKFLDAPLQDLLAGARQAADDSGQHTVSPAPTRRRGKQRAERTDPRPTPARNPDDADKAAS